MSSAENAAAQSNIDRAMRSALAAIRKLDIIVPNLLRENSTALAKWEVARRVDYFRGRRRASTTATPEAPTDVAVAESTGDSSGGTDAASPGAGRASAVPGSSQSALRVAS